MSYKKCFHQKLQGNNYKIHLWTDEGYEKIDWINQAYVECSESEATHIGLNNEPLKKVRNWQSENLRLHFHDMPPYQKFLVEKYGIDDTPSISHRELFFDIETEMLDSLTFEYIQTAPKKITSIAWYDKQVQEWGVLILDEKNQLRYTNNNHKEVIPCRTESELLSKFIEKFREIDPDIIIGYNSDYFDIPYLYYRMFKILGKDMVKHLSPIGIVRETPWYYDLGQYIQIAGVESLDYLRLHKKYYWKGEPSYTLNAMGLKYVNMGKIEYTGSLDKLFKDDINLFIKYNFRDVEILVALDNKFEYISITKNISHKGKHNYSEVYYNTKTQDGAISAYLLSQGIIPPAKDRNLLKKKNYAGGFLFCPQAGIFNYLFDEDLVSQYPKIIMSLNLGKETMMGRIITSDDRDNRLGYLDLKKKDPKEEITIENSQRKRATITVKKLIELIEENKWSISANGVFFRTDKKSLLSIILSQWFDERVKYNNLKKKYSKEHNVEETKKFHLLQYTMKILLNSTYGALAIPSFRYGNVLLAEAITLTGQRLIQESSLFINTHINKVMRGEIKFKFKKKKN